MRQRAKRTRPQPDESSTPEPSIRTRRLLTAHRRHAKQGAPRCDRFTPATTNAIKRNVRQEVQSSGPSGPIVKRSGLRACRAGNPNAISGIHPMLHCCLFLQELLRRPPPLPRQLNTGSSDARWCCDRLTNLIVHNAPEVAPPSPPVELGLRQGLTQAVVDDTKCKPKLSRNQQGSPAPAAPAKEEVHRGKLGQHTSVDVAHR